MEILIHLTKKGDKKFAKIIIISQSGGIVSSTEIVANFGIKAVSTIETNTGGSNGEIEGGNGGTGGSGGKPGYGDGENNGGGDNGGGGGGNDGGDGGNDDGGDENDAGDDENNGGNNGGGGNNDGGGTNGDGSNNENEIMVVMRIQMGMVLTDKEEASGGGRR
eukprot:TRINITY_DN1049_c0_g1_i3.p2 TRINITY_DN1049_c0_g1~~TRINITY_DN1049_c0_g1_i3.p2  ORF type:complete len:163 (-),score=64.23 TRINITY_DN1049_c0_g1_i3:30-518(-)